MSLVPRSAAYRIFWLGRYLERVENTCRLLEAQYFATLDGRMTAPHRPWELLLNVLGLYETYFRRYHRISPRDVAHFILFEPTNPSSVINSLAIAREDGSGTLPDNIFVELNKLYLQVRDTNIDSVMEESLSEFLTEIIRRIQLIGGLIDRHWVY